MNKKDLTGTKFSRWTVIKLEKIIKSQYFWLCKCDCGNDKVVRESDLKRGKSKSCKCLRGENLALLNTKLKSTHKKCKTTEYKSWSSIKSRCLNKKDKDYHNYGGRGITICENWKNSFENFLKDMGTKPNNEYSIDRINNNLGYFKENCKWANSKEQARNRRKNVIVLNLETGIYYNTLSEASETYHLTKSTFLNRFYKNKLSNFLKC